MLKTLRQIERNIEQVKLIHNLGKISDKNAKEEISYDSTYNVWVLLKYKNHEKSAVFVLLTSISYFVHIVLDCFFSRGLTANVFPGGDMLGICKNVASTETVIYLDAIFIGMFLLYLMY